MNDLVFHPVLAWPLLIAAVLVILALIGWSLFVGLQSKRRLALVAALRLLALAAIVFVLAQPQEQKQDVTILRPQIAVLVDNSASMIDPVDDSQPHPRPACKRIPRFTRNAGGAQGFRLPRLQHRPIGAACQ